MLLQCAEDFSGDGYGKPVQVGIWNDPVVLKPAHQGGLATDRRVFRQGFGGACRETQRFCTRGTVLTQPAAVLALPGDRCLTNAQLERMREYGISIRGCRDCHWGLCNPRNGLRFRPIAQNRTEFRQVDEKTVRFSGRLDRSLLRMVLSGLSPRKAVLSSGWDAQGSAQMPKW